MITVKYVAQRRRGKQSWYNEFCLLLKSSFETHIASILMDEEEVKKQVELTLLTATPWLVACIIFNSENGGDIIVRNIS
jgi:hypothetical protein